MYHLYPNYYLNPAAPFTYQDLQQISERQASHHSMCHYTVKFFECDHKTDDNVKGCHLWKKTGTHCDIDNPAVRKREDCSIRSENTRGLCPRCKNLERARLLKEKEEERERIEREREEELLRKDLEKARLMDQEEQRRNAEAHEAHLRRVQAESEAAWRTESEIKGAKSLGALESQTSGTGGDTSLNTKVAQYQSKMAGVHMSISTNFMLGHTQDFTSSHAHTASTRPGTSSPTRMKELAHSSTDHHTETIKRTSLTSMSALSGSSSGTIDTNVLLQKVAELRETTTRISTTRTTTTTVRSSSPTPSSPSCSPSSSPSSSPSPSPPPSPPRFGVPSYPPIDYSQPPKDQSYDRFMIGGRRQPVHPSQKLESEHPLSPTAPTIPRSRAPQPTVRLAGGVVPPSPPSSSPFNGTNNSLFSERKPRVSRTHRSISKEEPVNELQALWDKKGIKRDTDEEESDGITAATVSPSESASQVDIAERRAARGHN